MLGGYRLIEALALLPILYLPREQENVILCTGGFAEMMAADVLRWRDVKHVHLLKAPLLPLIDPSLPKPRADRRVLIGTPAVGSCTAVLTSPGEDPDPYLGFLAKNGVINVSRTVVTEVQPMLWALRRLFPRGIVPWREYLPQELYGCLASPAGAPRRVREPPGGARRLTASYIKNLFNFGADELPMIMNGKPNPPAPSTPVPGLGVIVR